MCNTLVKYAVYLSFHFNHIILISCDILYYIMLYYYYTYIVLAFNPTHMIHYYFCLLLDVNKIQLEIGLAPISPPLNLRREQKISISLAITNYVTVRALGRLVGLSSFRRRKEQTQSIVSDMFYVLAFNQWCFLGWFGLLLYYFLEKISN